MLSQSPTALPLGVTNIVQTQHLSDIIATIRGVDDGIYELSDNVMGIWSLGSQLRYVQSKKMKAHRSRVPNVNHAPPSTTVFWDRSVNSRIRSLLSCLLFLFSVVQEAVHIPGMAHVYYDTKGSPAITRSRVIAVACVYLSIIVSSYIPTQFLNVVFRSYVKSDDLLLRTSRSLAFPRVAALWLTSVAVYSLLTAQGAEFNQSYQKWLRVWVVLTYALTTKFINSLGYVLNAAHITYLRNTNYTHLHASTKLTEEMFTLNVRLLRVLVFCVICHVGAMCTFLLHMGVWGNISLFTSFIFAIMAVSTQLALTNVMGFLYLNSIRPFQMWDIVRINGKTYKVQGITLYATSLVNTSHEITYMSNSTFLGTSLLNEEDAFERGIEMTITFPVTCPNDVLVNIISDVNHMLRKHIPTLSSHCENTTSDHIFNKFGNLVYMRDLYTLRIRTFSNIDWDEHWAAKTEVVLGVRNILNNRCDDVHLLPRPEIKYIMTP
jgi:small-conductance mechanosensitive channel